MVCFQPVGNWYQFRPSYQWSGFRVADPAVIGHYTRLLDQLKIPYAWQVEGRTLAGSRINPSLETLATPMFRGKQAHENDGGYYYGSIQYQGVFSDMAARNRLMVESLPNIVRFIPTTASLSIMIRKG